MRVDSEKVLALVKLSSNSSYFSMMKQICDFFKTQGKKSVSAELFYFHRMCRDWLITWAPVDSSFQDGLT